MKITSNFLVLAVVLFLATALCAQTTDVAAKPLTDNDIALLRQDIQKSKNEIITDGMKFSKAESESFWPIYKEYAGEQQAINQTRLNILTDYAVNLDKLNAEKAHELTTRMLTVDENYLALKRKYLPRFENALGGTRAAKFFQIDTRLTAILNLQLAAEVPLIP